MLTSDDEDECLCPHPVICTCLFELEWMTALREPLFSDGFRHGFLDGIDQGIYDTRYRQPKYDKGFINDPLPWNAYIDPCQYKHAYSKGYQEGYREVYARHRPVLNELEQYHGLQWMILTLFGGRQTHPLIEYALIEKIENYVWVRPAFRKR
jgi:hypothetical protein